MCVFSNFCRGDFLFCQDKWFKIKCFKNEFTCVSNQIIILSNYYFGQVTGLLWFLTCCRSSSNCFFFPFLYLHLIFYLSCWKFQIWKIPDFTYDIHSFQTIFLSPTATTFYFKPSECKNKGSKPANVDIRKCYLLNLYLCTLVNNEFAHRNIWCITSVLL